jgi:chromosome segregation ATPase
MEVTLIEKLFAVGSSLPTHVALLIFTIIKTYGYVTLKEQNRSLQILQAQEQATQVKLKQTEQTTQLAPQMFDILKTRIERLEQTNVISQKSKLDLSVRIGVLETEMREANKDKAEMEKVIAELKKDTQLHIDLINRLQTENEALQNKLDEVSKKYLELLKKYNAVKRGRKNG